MRSAIRSLSTGLADWRFQKTLAIEYMPVIYCVLALGWIAITLGAMADYYRFSWQRGVIYSVTVGPMMLLAGLVTIRVVLEFLQAFFRTDQNVTSLDHKVGSIRDQVDTTAQRVGQLQDSVERFESIQPLRSLLPKKNDAD